jgi:MFS family permease
VGQLAERWGGKPLVVTGLGLQATGLAWLAAVTTTTTPYADLVVPFLVCGIGMTLFFVPLASLVLGAVPRSLEGVASGANAAFRELGGVLGIAVLGAIFSSHGSYASGQSYVNGMTVAVYAGAAVVAIGAVAALFVPSRRTDRSAPDLVAPEVLPDLAAASRAGSAGSASDRTLGESAPAPV